MLSAATDLVARIAGRFSRLLNSPFRLTAADGTRPDRRQLGEFGERVAAAWLRRHGCRILARNFRAPHGGEVDLVVRDGAVLVFAEVKTRTAGGRGRPLDAVDRDKQRLVKRGAEAWLKLLGTRELAWRFDVVEVVVAAGERPRVHRVHDAF
jgi:putative endonuclease